MLLGTPQGREADKRARCHQRRARRRARGREARTELKQMIIGSRGWIAPLQTDCDKARGAGHRTGRAAGFLRSQQPCSSGLAGFFFFFPLVSRKSRCRGGEFPPFPPSFFFFSSHHPKATCLGGLARARHPASPSPPDAYLGLDFSLGQSHVSNPGAATPVPADVRRLRAHPIRLPLGYSTRLVLQSSLKICYNRQVHKVFDGDS